MDIAIAFQKSLFLPEVVVRSTSALVADAALKGVQESWALTSGVLLKRAQEEGRAERVEAEKSKKRLECGGAGSGESGNDQVKKRKKQRDSSSSEPVKLSKGTTQAAEQFFIEEISPANLTTSPLNHKSVSESSETNVRKSADNTNLTKQGSKTKLSSSSTVTQPNRFAPFVVSQVVGKRYNCETGILEYKVRWSGVTEKYNSWLSESEIPSKALIEYELQNQFSERILE